MNIRTFLQLIILLVIFVIIGAIYFAYFYSGKINNELIINKDNIENKQINDDKDSYDKSLKEGTKNNNLTIEKKISEIPKDNKPIDIKEIEENKDLKEDYANKEFPDNESNNNLKNIMNEIEYITTDDSGNKFKIVAKSGRSSKLDNNILELIEVKGSITSNKRSTIFIKSDYARYNSKNQNSQFFQNVKVNFEEKEISSENFDIDINKNLAIAYNDVVVSDPKSKVKAGKITLDILTKDISINPQGNKKIKITTN